MHSDNGALSTSSKWARDRAQKERAVAQATDGFAKAFIGVFLSSFASS